MGMKQSKVVVKMAPLAVPARAMHNRWAWFLSVDTYLLPGSHKTSLLCKHRSELFPVEIAIWWGLASRELLREGITVSQ